MKKLNQKGGFREQRTSLAGHLKTQGNDKFQKIRRTNQMSEMYRTTLEKYIFYISVKRIATLNATFKMTELEVISQTEN